MNSIIKVFSILLVHQSACQICNETRSIFREVPETYRFTYIETYEEPCIIFCSVKTRKSVNVTTRIVQRFENATLNVCCEGYVEDDDHKGNGLYCKPVCNPPCQNGYCRKPNQCACEAGYALDPLNPHVCKPLCLEGCEIPHCISTKTPQCHSYNNSELMTNSQSPVCKEPCVNAKCVGPEICQCLPGYHHTSAYNCKPTSYFATESCEHGTLLDPHTCLCDEGWQWECGSCVPTCDRCEHGTCTLPGQCTCKTGYVMEESQCKPQCSNGCANGRCVSPEVCSCNPGWYKTKEGECKAHCDMHCEHGNCIAPNVCECDIGYQLYINKGISRCVPNRKDCEGSSDPENCKCEAPYEVIYFADNGGNCECIGVCLNSSSRCTNATCLYMDVAFDMNPPELDYDHDINEKMDKNPVLKEVPVPTNVEFSTLSTVERYEHTERYDGTSPELDYDYDSEEEGDEVSDVKVTPNTHNDEMSTLSTIEGNEDTVKTSAIKTSLEVSNDRNEKTLKIDQETPDIKDDESTLPALTKKNIDGTNVAKPALNLNDPKKRESTELSVYWIIGAVTVGVIIVLMLLGFFLKRKCFKKQSLKSSGKHDDIVVHYTNKIS